MTGSNIGPTPSDAGEWGRGHGLLMNVRYIQWGVARRSDETGIHTTPSTAQEPQHCTVPTDEVAEPSCVQMPQPVARIWGRVR